jgi:hypothetical protein
MQLFTLTNNSNQLIRVVTDSVDLTCQPNEVISFEGHLESFQASVAGYCGNRVSSHWSDFTIKKTELVDLVDGTMNRYTFPLVSAHHSSCVGCVWLDFTAKMDDNRFAIETVEVRGNGQ